MIQRERFDLKIDVFILDGMRNEKFSPRHDKTCLRDFPTTPDTSRPVQPQKLARVLKFRL